MRMIPLAAASMLALAAHGEGAMAQQGPSFDCDDAGTRTEHAICGSPRLASLERDAVRAYEALAARIGEAEAWRIADGLLVERQACEGDVACIETMLTVSAGVFALAGPGSPASLAEAIRAARALREGESASRPAAAPVPDLDALIARERAEREATATAPSAPEPATELALDADVAPPREVAAGSTFGRAFGLLPEEDRLTVERNLAAAGLLDEAADGDWGEATEEALEAVVRRTGEDGSPLDVSDVPGASVLLDFVASEAFQAAGQDIAAPGQFQW